MSGAITTMGKMAERITLQRLSEDIKDLRSVALDGFSYAEKMFGGIRDRIDRMEYGIYQLQKDFLVLDEEIRGIHRVIDNLNIRMISLENNRGSVPLFPLD
ncbi:MAG TPA: hypothetical protein VMR99_00055 [Candidatus Paceibacterota bacterium]|nr:hypothetical protein [Candidatus Paceibacterota bacterium]